MLMLIVFVYCIISKSDQYSVGVHGFSVYEEKNNDVNLSIVAPVWCENTFFFFHFDSWNGGGIEQH